MMTSAEIQEASSKHLKRSFAIILSVYVVAKLTLRFGLVQYFDVMVKPLQIATLFFLVETVVVSLLWRWVAMNHKDMLSTFHTACSGFRMLLSLMLLLVAYLVVGRDGISPYFLCVVVLYFLTLVLHTVFFTRQATRIFD